MKNRLIIIILFICTVFFIQAAVIKSVPLSKEKLGELLFSDPILSKDRKISCATCHKPSYAFADTSTVSKGVAGEKGTRNTPTAMNLSLAKTLFWDGRVNTLEEQALAPIMNPKEMNLPIEKAIIRLKNNEKYREYFKAVFNSEPTKTNLAIAIAAFARTLETSNSAFDNWKYSDDSNAVSASVKKGFTIFNEKGKCVKCHFGADLTANEFRNIGLFNGKNLNDSGRFAVTGDAADIGKFKTSSLRNIAITGPYMHNGMFKTLEAVIDFYNDTKKTVPNAINKDSILLQPLGLTKQEKKELKAFLLSLTDKQFKLKKNVKTKNI